MSPTRPFARVCAVAALTGALAAPAAHADLTLVQTTTISNPQITAALQSMTPQQRAQVQKSGSPFFQTGPQTTTIYTHGRQSRLDYGAYSVIADPAKGQITTLNRRTRTYSTRPLAQNQSGGFAGATVRDLHQTKTILGHVAHHYTVATANVGGAGSQLKADVWAAPDLAQPTGSLTGGGPAGPLQSLLRQVKGLPLQTTLVVAGSPVGTVSVKLLARSLSTRPVAASVFALPAGYKPGQVAAPGGSSPLGDGIGQ